MIDLSTVTGQEVSKNKDGDDDVRILMVECEDEEDVQTVQLLHTGGHEYCPHPGARAVIVDVGSAYRIAIALDDLAVPDLVEGECRIYSTDDTGARKAVLTLRVDGTMELLGTGDFAVRYNELKKAFDQLKKDHDDFISLKYNLHVHPGVLAGPASTGVTPTVGAASTANMATAKIDKIKVPS